MRKALTDEQLEIARSLKAEGKTNREIAKLFEVGKTTIWENIYATKKRVRIFKVYIQKPPKEHCRVCEIAITRELKGNYIPMNFKIGQTCISCYLESRGQSYKDLITK